MKLLNIKVGHLLSQQSELLGEILEGNVKVGVQASRAETSRFSESHEVVLRNDMLLRDIFDGPKDRNFESVGVLDRICG